MAKGKLLMVSTDRQIFDSRSAVFARQAVYAREWEEVHIIVFAKKGKVPDEMVVAPNCWAYSTYSWSKFLYPFDAMKLGRFIIGRRGITNITCQDASLTAMAGVSLKKHFNLPLEIQIHEDLGSPYYARTLGNRLRKSLALSFLPKADRIRVVSKRISDYLTGKVGIDASKIFIRPIGVDIEAIKKTSVTTSLKTKYSQFNKIVMMASRLEPEKDIQMAVKAWPAVVAKFPRAGLIIVGRGSQEERLKALAKRLSISQSIIFEPWADRQTLISFYKTADLFVNTSFFEGYGMTLVEAHAAGCPIVSTDVGVAPEVGAHLVEHDKDELAAAIIDELSK